MTQEKAVIQNNNSLWPSNNQYCKLFCSTITVISSDIAKKKKRTLLVTNADLCVAN